MNVASLQRVKETPGLDGNNRLENITAAKTSEEFICDTEIVEKEHEIKLDNTEGSEKDVNEVGSSLSSIALCGVFKMPSAAEIVEKENQNKLNDTEDSQKDTEEA